MEGTLHPWISLLEMNEEGTLHPWISLLEMNEEAYYTSSLKGRDFMLTSKHKNPCLLTPCDLHRFRFMITFTPGYHSVKLLSVFGGHLMFMNTPLFEEEGSYTYKHLLLIIVRSYPFLNSRCKNRPPPIGYTSWSSYVEGPHKIVATWFIYSLTIESKMLSKCHWNNIQGLYMIILSTSFTHNIKKKMGIT